MTAFPALFAAFSRTKKKAGETAGVGTDALLGHFCPQCGQLTGVSAQAVMAPFEQTFGAAGTLIPVNTGVPRIFVVPYGRFGRKLR